MTRLVDAEITADLVRGAVELETTRRGLQPHRLPAWARSRADPQVLGAESCPAGVRLVFATTATVIELDAHRTTTSFRRMPPRPDGMFHLLVNGVLHNQQPSSGGRRVVRDLATGAVESDEGPVATVRFAGLPAGDKLLEIWLPHHEPTELVALRGDAPLRPGPPDARRTWVHHGSSISQGSNATSPTTAWPILAAAAGGVNLVNLGFSGGMMLDPYVARAIRDIVPHTHGRAPASYRGSLPRRSVGCRFGSRGRSGTPAAASRPSGASPACVVAALRSPLIAAAPRPRKASTRRDQGTSATDRAGRGSSTAGGVGHSSGVDRRDGDTRA